MLVFLTVDVKIWEREWWSLTEIGEACNFPRLLCRRTSHPGRRQIRLVVICKSWNHCTFLLLVLLLCLDYRLTWSRIYWVVSETQNYWRETEGFFANTFEEKLDRLNQHRISLFCELKTCIQIINSIKQYEIGSYFSTCKHWGILYYAGKIVMNMSWY